YLLSPFFFFNAPPTTVIYTLSLHDALPIFLVFRDHGQDSNPRFRFRSAQPRAAVPHEQSLIVHSPGRSEFPLRRCRPASPSSRRSEEHTSELQSLAYLVCRLLLEKKKKQIK